ncbi:MAG: nucleotidyl transferase [Deltaproteobacteria bacterium]|nr:MAG: nucleotidyl transferase [Deltaproteobacteria bacterium]
MQAMILAAGLGTRLLPHTKLRPKPLFPVLNTPLLLLTIARLKNFGFGHIIVNCHHLRQQIVEAVSALDGVFCLEEDLILGTGGALKNALPYLHDEPLLVSNGDIYHSVDLKAFYNFHRQSGAGITMALHDCPRFNTVSVAEEKILGFRAEKTATCLAYTGLQVVNPEILEGLDSGVYTPLISYYTGLLNQDQVLACLRVDGCFWTDMGTPEDYLGLHAGLLQGTVPRWPEISLAQRPFALAEKSQIASSADLEDWVCVGEAVIGRHSRLRRCVVWDDVCIGDGMDVCDQLVSTSLP